MSPIMKARKRKEEVIMISTQNITLRFGAQLLFENVNIKFTPGNCYGLIGANGSGKSTFLKILAGEVEQTHGDVIITPGERIATLRQDHFAFDAYPVLDTVIMGHRRLYEVMKEKDAIYAKENFLEADGERAAALEDLFNEFNGWDAEFSAAQLLSDLGIEERLHASLMQELTGAEKVRVLLAQALFGDPDILLLDEPTNHLDVETIMWLEDFLYHFKHTVIVVSHDRHFLNQVCTHIADIDFTKIKLYTGNYDFWRQSSELAQRQLSDKNKKTEDKRKELQEFITRFSANASKSRQATSRKKLLEKLTLEDIKPSTRKYPAIVFSQEREAGDRLLSVRGVSIKGDDGMLVRDFHLEVEKGQKIAFVSQNDVIISELFDVFMGEKKQESGVVEWGTTITAAYFPKDNTKFFDCDLDLMTWLKQYCTNKEETFVRGFLGRMLFLGDEVQKKVNVLSGGERVRCMLARMMAQGANVIVLNEPTNHLDLESITALNTSLTSFPGTILFASHDHTFVQTIANRIIEVGPRGVLDRLAAYDEYLEAEKENRAALYHV